ncbi:hypothetical protein EJF36_07515 [Bacillus sp. HMF5848]|uniref:hypothetical protein n=1 Tax=Bacillus sp. HMF5848 TaxID=2495421 RepID=UPI000F7A435D|nr:hypothetical protein [Bacillus sp. HMF5848]RSK26720.1 hypothetical protein EJF36_07515 [Bacillus sp. HMF5848]
MYTFPNLHDFYQRPLIEISEHDIKHLVSSDIATYTHWLIGVEGTPVEDNSEKYHWKIYVYPTNQAGNVSWDRPQYISDSIPCFHLACDKAKEIEYLSIADGIINSVHSSKIS